MVGGTPRKGLLLPIFCHARIEVRNYGVGLVQLDIDGCMYMRCVWIVDDAVEIYTEKLLVIKKIDGVVNQIAN